MQFIAESLSRRSPAWLVLLARTHLGVIFTLAGINKALATEFWIRSYGSWEERVTAYLPELIERSWSFYTPVLTGILIPNSELIAKLAMLGEIVVGVLLLVGLKTRIAAAGALFLLANYFFVQGRWLFATGAESAYGALALLVLLAANTKVWGTDSWLHNRHSNVSQSANDIKTWILVIVRAWFGIAFLIAASNKIGSNWEPWPGWLQQGLTRRLENMPGFYQQFIENLVLPNVEAFAYTVAVGEVAIGLALLFGVMTPVAAGAGIFLTVNFFLYKGAFLLNPINDIAFVTGLTILIAGRAGQCFGIDLWLFKAWNNTKSD